MAIETIMMPFRAQDGSVVYLGWDEMTDQHWARVFKNPDAQRFRNEFALMCASCPPYLAPSEGDYKTYRWQLNPLYSKRHMVVTKTPGFYEEVSGVELLCRAMANATRTATDRRPSVGSVWAHATAMKADQPLASRSLPAKPFVPPTPDQLAEMRADIKNRAWRMDANEALKSRKTERKGA